MAVLEGRSPNRRPHHAAELAVIVMSRTSSSEVILRQGGLGVMKFYVSPIIEPVIEPAATLRSSEAVSAGSAAVAAARPRRVAVESRPLL
jgi:hypothetical protein